MHPSCQLTKLIEDDGNFLSMLGGEDVGQQGCFACTASNDDNFALVIFTLEFEKECDL